MKRLSAAGVPEQLEAFFNDGGTFHSLVGARPGPAVGRMQQEQVDPLRVERGKESGNMGGRSGGRGGGATSKA